MKRLVLALFGLMLCPLRPAVAQAFSLFFTPDQIERIENEVQKNPQLLSTQSQHLLHVESILFFGPDNWVVWIQGEKWTPDTRRDNISINAVLPESVSLSLTLQGESVVNDVILAPHQSLDLLTGKITEGL